MAQLRVRRWAKGPHDRLYVSTASGIDVGWYDLRSRRHHLNVPGMWPQFQDAVTNWQADHAGASANGPAVHVSVKSIPPPGHSDDRTTAEQWLREHRQRRAGSDEDLASRRAGHNAAAMAQQLAPPRGVRLLARLVGVQTRDLSWRVGAAGEQAVGGHLDPLARRGWRVLHAVNLGFGGDIDHLLIGPAGVFTVNTKHHPGAHVRMGNKVVFVRGRQQPYIGKAGREAARVREALSAAVGRPIHVAPLIVVHGHRSLRGWMSQRPQGVQVLPSWAVTWWFRLPGRAVLTPVEIDELYAHARRPATWSTC